MRLLSCLAALALVALPAVQAPVAQAKVLDATDAGFAVAHTARVAASPDDVWKMLRAPDKWWSKSHSWSGDAANFWMDTQAGGCFCEKLPHTGGMVGSVQHARIIYADAGKLLRLSGALGPLQSEAVTGTLTIVIKPNDKGSVILFEYVVGGYARFPLKSVAPVVDSVIGEQLAGLAKALGGALPPPADAAAKAAPADKALPTEKAAAVPVKPAASSPAAKPTAAPTAPATAAKPAVPPPTAKPAPAPALAPKPVDPAKPKP